MRIAVALCPTVVSVMPRMAFKDKCNRACNHTAKPRLTVHLSNLCTEIIEITSAGETAVCNLGSINLARHMGADGFDFEKLAHTVDTGSVCRRNQALG